jgi:Xaa-Pro aminopeptidase
MNYLQKKCMTRSKLPRLIVASSEGSADILYATRFFAPDAFIFLEKAGRKTIVLSDLEIDRGRRQAEVDEVVAYSDISARLEAGAGLADVLRQFLKERRVRKARVPADFPLGLASRLAASVELLPEPGLFWKEREFKSAAETARLRRAEKIAETGMARAMEVLAAADVGKANALTWAGQRLTSDLLRTEIDSAVLRAGGQPAGTIVAGGSHACDPHERGFGPLRANSLIIIDIFPRDASTGYFGDLTRTVVRGRASEPQRRLWETVWEGQALALESMRPGVDGGKLQEEVKQFFTQRGFPTEKRAGRWGGFFHGLGHGLGLEIHEEPRVAKTTLTEGQVLTVEPGLYYNGIGGARIEDVVAITSKGIKMLSGSPKRLEI